MSETWQQLTRIADALERLVELQEQLMALELDQQMAELPTTVPSEPTTETCPHPPDQRVSFGLLPDGTEEWECRTCRMHVP